MIRFGFTGTQDGMTSSQLAVVESLLTIFRMGDEPPVMNHGCCIGADYQMHNIARRLGYRIRLFPSNIPIKTAPCEGAERRAEAKPPLTRNGDIVEESDRMIAAPHAEKEVVRSGTWHTIRLTRQALKPLIIVWPSGKLRLERWPHNW